MQGRLALSALQLHLAAARAADARGERDAALAELRDALDIDPDFLAAQTLRDRLLAAPLGAASSSPRLDAPPPTVRAATSNDISADGYAKFQQRARQRRLDTRIEAARDALRRRRSNDASAALAEVRELDPEHPELAALTGQLDALRRQPSTSRRGVWMIAAATCAAAVFAVAYLQDSPQPGVPAANRLASRPVATAGSLKPTPTQAAAAADDQHPVAATGEPSPVDVVVGRVELAPPVAAPPVAAPPVAAPPVAAPPAAPPVGVPAAVPRAEESIAVPPAPSPSTVSAIAPATLPPAPAPLPIAPPLPPPAVVVPPPKERAVEEVAAPAPAPAAKPVAAAPATAASPSPVDDSALVRNVLQRYRIAYQRLDARSAHAIWPAVDEAALARAFEGLASQTLTFDACDVRLNGAAASAACRGSAAYVPKIGSREPRVEPRRWSFTLRKTGADWTIDTARVDR